MGALAVGLFREIMSSMLTQHFFCQFSVFKVFWKISVNFLINKTPCTHNTIEFNLNPLNDTKNDFGWCAKIDNDLKMWHITKLLDVRESKKGASINFHCLLCLRMCVCEFGNWYAIEVRIPLSIICVYVWPRDHYL